MLFAANQDAAFAILGCTGVFCIGILLVTIIFHITLMNAIQACSPRNQAMPPGLVWLNFVPLLNLVWQFVNVIQVGNSLQAEYRDRGMRSDDPSFGKTLGLSYIILGLVANGINIIGRQVIGMDDDAPAGPQGIGIAMGILVMVLALVQLILFIIYWVKIAGFTRELNNSPRRSQYNDGYDDRDDGYDRRRRARDDDDGDRDYDREYERRREERDDSRGRSAERDEDDRPTPARADARTVVTCPECSGKVDVAEADLGHEMWCPLCDKVFTAMRDDGGDHGLPRYPGS